MAKLSRAVPGGFLTLDNEPGRRLVIRMVDTTHADTVRAVLLNEWSDLTPQERQLAKARLDSAELRPVPFSTADLYDWKSYIAMLLAPDSPGGGLRFSGIGASPQDGRVRVDALREHDRVWVEDRLARANIPCGLVETHAYEP